MSKSKKVLIIILLLTLVSLYFNFQQLLLNLEPETAKSITLVDYKVAHVEESGEILLITRDDNKLQYVISDSLSLIILFLKQQELSKDYENITN